MILCDICGEKVETKSALYSHRYRRHKDRTKSIELHIRTSEEPKVIDTVPLDLHLHQAIEDPLDKYLKDRNNRYNAKDFDNYLKKMKTKDKKSAKAEPYARPEEDGEGGPSSGNVGELSICHICDEEFSTQKARGEHMERRHPICKLCNDRFKSVDKLKHHFEIFHPPNAHALKCPTCDAKFSEINDLIRHTDEHPQCEICMQRFLDVPSLGKHRKVHEKLPLSKKRKFGDFGGMCGLCNRMFNKNMRQFGVAHEI